MDFFCNKTFGKGEIKTLVLWILKNYGTNKASLIIDKLKNVGFDYATKAGISIGIEDLKVSNNKKKLLEFSEIDNLKNEVRFLRGKIASVSYFKKNIDLWNNTNEILINESVTNFRQTNTLNPVYMMAFSGARGNLSQVRQLVGMRGLMSDSKGDIIPVVIKNNFREGLTITEYLISCYGARKGLIDTALRTANSGYLTRRLVDVAQNVTIRSINCGSHNGILLKSLIKEKNIIIPMEKRLLGRVLAKNVLHRKTKKVIVSKGQDICFYLSKKIIKFSDSNRVFLRSPLTCESLQDVCQLCYGWNLATYRLAEIGEPVGVIAAQSIGEPGTQLTMRTFHTGGVFIGNISDTVFSLHNGKLNYSLNFTKKFRTKFGEQAILTLRDKFILVSENIHNTSKIKLPKYSLVFFRPNQRIGAKQVIAEICRTTNFLEPTKVSSSESDYKEIFSTNEGQLFFDLSLRECILWILNGQVEASSSLVIFLLHNYTRYKSHLFSKRMYINYFFAHFCGGKSLNLISYFLQTRKNHSFVKNSWFNLNKTFYLEKNLGFQLRSFKSEKKSLLHSKKNEIYVKKKTNSFFIKSFLGNLNSKKNLGQLIAINANSFIFRTGTLIATLYGAKTYLPNGRLISKNEPFLYLFYKREKVTDIVEGLPKIEQLLEARKTQGFTPIMDNLHLKLEYYFKIYSNHFSDDVAALKSLEKIRDFITQKVQSVYSSQNIDVSDKHIEIIVKLMTQFAVITKSGDSDFLMGETVKLNKIRKINKVLKNKVKFEPVVHGITRVALKAESFLSAASFQDTTRILAEAALQGKIDWLDTFKEKIILGKIAPIGTGVFFKEFKLFQLKR